MAKLTVTFVEVTGPGVEAGSYYSLRDPDYGSTLAALHRFEQVDRAEAEEGLAVVVGQVSRERDPVSGMDITSPGGGGQQFRLGEAGLEATVDALQAADFKPVVSLLELLDAQEGCGGDS